MIPMSTSTGGAALPRRWRFPQEEPGFALGAHEGMASRPAQQQIEETPPLRGMDLAAIAVWAAGHILSIPDPRRIRNSAWISSRRLQRISASRYLPRTRLTPGQAVVFYDGDNVLGGGCIAAALTEGP